MPTYATNKKARFEYEILEKYEAGLVLSGQEVKSIRTGNARLQGAFVTVHDNTVYLTNANIPRYKYGYGTEDYDPDQSRKLLLKQKEIDYLRGKSQEKGLTIVPLSIYTKGRRLKIEIAVARGKKLHDKRRTMKERDSVREVRRAFKDALSN